MGAVFVRWHSAFRRKPSSVMSALHRLGGRGPSTIGQLCWLLVLTTCAWATKIAAIVILVSALTDLPWLTLIGGIVAGEVSEVLPVHGIAGAGTYEAAFVAGAIYSVFNDLAIYW